MTGVCALIPAAGRGARFGAAQNKVFAPLLGRPLLGWTLQAFADCDVVDDIVLIGSEDDLPRLREIGKQYGGGKLRDVVLGGADRQESVRLGLAACPPDKLVAIHDAARPCVDPETINGVVNAARMHGCAIAAVPVTDSLIRGIGKSDVFPMEDVSRDDLWAVQTPQVFNIQLLRNAHQWAEAAGINATDDSALIRRLGDPVFAYYASPENLKVTQPEDLALAEAILLRRQRPSPSFRIGHGYDVHAFAAPSENRPLILGGVPFPDAERGLIAHSDGDVVLHALCDALLGAAGLEDIGKLFPPSDMRHKDRSSVEFLREVAARLHTEGWGIGNVDITVLAEFPKIGPKSDAMKAIISVELGIETGQIGIKATTNEGLGSIGRGEGIAVHATVLLMRTP